MGSRRPRITRGPSDEYIFYNIVSPREAARLPLTGSRSRTSRGRTAIGTCSMQQLPAGNKWSAARASGGPAERSSRERVRETAAWASVIDGVSDCRKGWGERERGLSERESEREVIEWVSERVSEGVSERAMCERKTERDDKDGKYGYRRPGNGCYVMVTAWLVFRHLPLPHTPPSTARRRYRMK